MRLFLIFISCLSIFSCIEPQNKFEKLPPGIWRGILYLDGTTVPIATDDETMQVNELEGELPFNFDVVYDTSNNFEIIIHNAEERIRISDISYGLDRATAKDTIVINFSEYDTYIKALYEDGLIQGHWYVNYKKDYRIPFKAFHGKSNRFNISEKSEINIGGNWKTTFEYDTEDAYPAIAQFKQQKENISGTFATETGDYRYLEGRAYGDKFKLSTFDGAHAFLYEGKAISEDSLIGIFRSGKHYLSNWNAERIKENDYHLSSPYEMTQVLNDTPLNFELLNQDGELTNLSQPKYQNKYKLIQIMGTWCPNCKDESKFLKAFFDKKPEDLEIISICFERYKDTTRALQVVSNYKKKMEIPYEMLYGGYYSKSLVSQVIPQIDKVYSYPTLLFVDKNNQIKKIHTGFYGPATKEYKDFTKDFYKDIKNLIEQ